MTACSKLDRTPRSRKSKPPSYPGRMQHCMAHGLCQSCQVRHNIANKEDLAPVFVARTTLARVRAAVMAVSSRCFSSFFSALISLRKWLRSPLSWAFLVFACKIKNPDRPDRVMFSFSDDQSSQIQHDSSMYTMVTGLSESAP